MNKMSTEKSIKLWKTRSSLVTDPLSKVLWPDMPFWNKYIDKWQYFYMKSYLDILKTSDTTLDLGCGIGRWTFRIAERCKLVYGVDISEDNINYAKLINRYNNVHFKVMDIRKLDFPDEFFDNVISCGCLCLVLDKDEFLQTLREVFRVLKAGGKLILLENIIKADNYISISHEEWFETIKLAGGEVISWKGIDLTILRKIMINIPFNILTKFFTRRDLKFSGDILERDKKTVEYYQKMSNWAKIAESFLLQILTTLIKPFEFTIPNFFPHRKSRYILIYAKKNE